MQILKYFQFWLGCKVLYREPPSPERDSPMFYNCLGDFLLFWFGIVWWLFPEFCVTSLLAPTSWLYSMLIDSVITLFLSVPYPDYETGEFHINLIL